MVRRFAVALLLIGCGPRVGGDDQGSGDGTAEGGTSTSASSSGTSTSSSSSATTVDASASETSEPACEREAVLHWEVFGNDLEMRPAAAATTPDGRIVVVGSTDAFYDASDASIELMDAAGSIVWSATYAGANDLFDGGLDVAVDDAGDVYVLVKETVTAIPDNKNPTVDERLVVLRYDASGERLWRWERERPPVEPNNNYTVEGQIEVVGDRVLVLEYTVYTNDDVTNLFELDRTGAFVSEVQLLGDASPVARDLAGNGEVVVLDWEGEVDALQGSLTRFTPDGAQKWVAMLGGDDERLRAAIAGPSGETYVAYAVTNPDVDATVYLRRFEPDGSEGWTQPMLVTSPYMQEVAGDVAPDGSVLVTASYSIVPLDDDRPGNRPLWVARYTPDGSCRAWLFERNVPTLQTASQGEVVVPIGDGAALVLATYHDEELQPWMGLVGE